jgi:hypothetical protein
MSETPKPFTTLGSFGTIGFNGVCVPKENVKPNNTDPNDPDYNGILEYKAFTLQEAMKVYWLMKEATVTGSASISASASISGSYERVIRVVNRPLTNPRTYRLETADSWSTTSTSPTFEKSTTMSLDNNNFRNDRDLTLPQNRICNNWSRGRRYFKMQGLVEGGSDFQPTGGSSAEINSSTSGSVGQVYYYSHGYGDGDYAYANTYSPPAGLRRFYDGPTDNEDNFVGYGFVNSLAGGECVVYANASVRPPYFVSYSGDEVSASVYMGGFFRIANIAYTEEFGQWYGTEQHATVSFGGLDVIAQGSGSENISISSTSAGVKFSFSDSDSISPSFDYDDKDEHGAGKTFSGSGSGECSGSFEIVFKNPDFYEY